MKKNVNSVLSPHFCNLILFLVLGFCRCFFTPFNTFEAGLKNSDITKGRFAGLHVLIGIYFAILSIK